MSALVTGVAWRLKLPATQKLVLVAMTDHAHDDGTKMYPSVALLAEKTGLDERTVRRSLAWLRTEAKVIELDAAASPRRPATYRASGVLAEGIAAAGVGRAPTQGGQTTHPGRADDPPRAGRAPTEPPVTTNTTSKNKGKAPARVPDAVAVLRQATGRYPARSWYDRIERVVGSTPEALARLGELATEWVGRGYNPTNVRGILDAFESGQPLAGRAPKRAVSRSERNAQMQAEAERYRRKKNGQESEQ